MNGDRAYKTGWLTHNGNQSPLFALIHSVSISILISSLSNPSADDVACRYINSLYLPKFNQGHQCQSPSPSVVTNTLADNILSQMAPVVTHEEWTKAREELLAKEKEFTRLRDELSKQRRDLPWEAVTKEYVFDGPNGQKQTLSQLFDGKSQLIIYHFMLGPKVEAGCPSCSYLADNFNGIDIHLAHRDTAFVAVSRAPPEKLQAYKERMGWTFKWVSAGPGNDLPYELGTAFTEEQIAKGAIYNYKEDKPFGTDYPGASVFIKDDQGNIFHTYSCYARGLDMFIGAYHWLDITPKGRDEADVKPHAMAWVRRHDEYEK